MTSFGQLALLVFAFLGMDATGAVQDVDTAGCRWEDYSISVYAIGTWEDCLIPGQYGTHNYDMPKNEWRALAEQVWASYEPWMKAQIAAEYGGWSLRRWSGTCTIPDDADTCEVTEWDPAWRYGYIDDDFEALMPKLVHGTSAVIAYCGWHAAGCYYSHGYGIGDDAKEVIGEGTWVTPDANSLSYKARVITRTASEPIRIALATRGGLVNRFAALQSLAQAINEYRSFGLEETPTPTKAGKYTQADLDLYSSTSQYSDNPEFVQNEAMGRRGIAYRCLVLDLYRAHTDAVPDDVYSVLNGLCRQYVPDYAMPHDQGTDSP